MKIKDIAAKAGVSTATVSNVINGNYHKVSQSTVEKVRQIIDEIGYSPSAAARSLRASPSTAVTSAAGSPKIPPRHPDSAPSAATPLTTATSFDNRQRS